MIVSCSPSLHHISLVCVYRWLFGETICQLYATCGVLFGLCSLTNLTALSFVCCLKVCFPNHGEGIITYHGDRFDHKPEQRDV